MNPDDDSFFGSKKDKKGGKKAEKAEKSTPSRRWFDASPPSSPNISMSELTKPLTKGGKPPSKAHKDSKATKGGKPSKPTKGSPKSKRAKEEKPEKSRVGAGERKPIARPRQPYGLQEESMTPLSDVPSHLLSSARPVGPSPPKPKPLMPTHLPPQAKLEVKRLYTSWYDETAKITPESHRNGRGLQDYMDTVAGQHSQAKIVSLLTGEYPGIYRFDRFASSVSIGGYNKGLRIVGDTRPFVGRVFSPDSFSIQGEEIQMPGLTGVVVGDHLIVISPTGALAEHSVVSVEGTTFKLSSALDSAEVQQICICPNVVLCLTNPKLSYLFTIVDTSVTFEGIRFSNRVPSPAKVSSLVNVVGASTVNFLNCVLDDLLGTCQTCLNVMFGASVIATELRPTNPNSSQPEDLPDLFQNRPLTLIGGTHSLTLRGGAIYDALLTETSARLTHTY